ncbi:MAG: putative hydrolase [Clostridiales bacterium]|jgi:putative hydrolase|nr:putative hydrolase [Clostridiales bacterium]MDN5297451.1 putative hydrolase [Clostridiales bacterium]
MRLKGDYHMHSKYSGDCKNEMEAVVKQAIEMGLSEIAITDHGPMHSGYGIKASQYPKMRAEIDTLRQKYPQISILLGLEANLIGTDGEIDLTDTMQPLCDWLNVGYHFGSNLGRDMGIHIRNFLSKFSKRIYERAKRDNTMAMVNAMRQHSIRMLTHPGAKGPIDIDTVARVAAETGTMLEINQSHGHLTTEEIKIAMQYDVVFVANSDAHRIERIGVVTDSIRRIVEAGLPAERIYNLDDA